MDRLVNSNKVQTDDSSPINWSLVADSVNDSVIVVGLDGSVKYANRFACEKLGYTPEEITKKKVFDFNPSFPSGHFPEFCERLKKERSARFESRHCNRAGIEYPVQISTTYVDPPTGEPFMVSLVSDVSETHLARMQLELAIESARVGFWDFDLATGEVFNSAELYRQIGLEADVQWDLEVFKSLLHPDDKEAAMKKVEDYLANPESQYINVFRLRHADGSYRWIQSRGQLLVNEAGKQARMIGTHLDVTAQKQIELELRKTLTQTERVSASLRRSNQDLEQFAYVASHDLRAPLRSVTHLVSWIREDTESAGVILPDPVHQHLDRLEKQVKRMDDLLAGLLEYSRVGRQKHLQQTVTLSELIDEAIGMAHLGPDFTVTRPKLKLTWTTYREPLQRILQNLLDNAAKHHDHKSGKIEIRCEDHEDHLCFRVIDDGPGIPENLRARIFEIFETLSGASAQSSGIGLSIVEKLVEAHGGTISVHAAEPRGTEFRFTWPKEIDLEDSSEAAEPGNEPPSESQQPATR